jgi:hypothetical protein
LKPAHGVKTFIPILLVLVLTAVGAAAMDRFDALSQIESRNNDLAIGRHQEISRYQILPAYWRQAVAWKDPATQLQPTDPAAARRVVNWIMQERCRAFVARYHRQPTDFEYYILWHRPACFVGRSVPRPITTAELDRGQRFASLCQSD